MTTSLQASSSVEESAPSKPLRHELSKSRIKPLDAKRRSISLPQMKVLLAKDPSQSTSSVQPSIPEETEKAKPKYNRLRNGLISLTSEASKCRMFCGGPACKYCDPFAETSDDPSKKLPQAIAGLFSTWITDDIIASSRPQTAHIQKYHTLKTFEKMKIQSIINLQRVGEHKFCGQPLDAASGFSYNPETFMQNGREQDYGIAPLTTLLDMVKVMNFALQQGKVSIPARWPAFVKQNNSVHQLLAFGTTEVLVHCHAGLGRTCVLIACYLVWHWRFPPDDAINFIRRKRPNSIQTRDQVGVIKKFADFLAPLHDVFSKCSNIEDYCERQRLVLHGYEERLFKYMPKIIFVALERLLELCYASASGTAAGVLESLITGDISECRTIYQLKNTICSTINSVQKQNQDGISSVDESNSDGARILKDSISKLISNISQESDNSEVDQKAREHEAKLNGSKEAWETLANETNPVVMLLLLTRWFATITEPLLPGTALSVDKGNAERSIEAMVANLPKTNKEIVTYILQSLQLISSSGINQDLYLVCATTLLPKWFSKIRYSESNSETTELDVGMDKIEENYIYQWYYKALKMSPEFS